MTTEKQTSQNGSLKNQKQVFKPQPDNAHCPFCGADDPQSDYAPLVMDAGVVEQHSYCLACEGEWFDVYSFSRQRERQSENDPYFNR